jgi:hypothetical protein
MAAEYRSVHTEMWRADDWFQTLPTDARLLWIYLFTNPSASVSGIYKLPLRTMANETGIDLSRVTELLTEFTTAKKAYYQDGILWVRKMRDYQLPGKLSDKLVTHLNKEIAKIPDGYLKREYLIAYGYRIDTHSRVVDTVSIPRATETDTDTDTETETHTETETRRPSFSDGSGYSAVSRASKWNNQVSAELRTPIADVILDIIGKRSLADVGGALGDKILDAAHECAVTIYKLGYKTPSAVLDIEPEWRQNWRGKDGGGTPEQLATFCAEMKGKAKAGSNGHNADPVTPKQFTVLYPDGTSEQVNNER